MPALSRLKEAHLIRHYAARYRSGLILVGVASTLLNVLVFSGSLYMILVYDSVLPSGSRPTLAGLFVMLVLVYLLQGAFDAIRAEALLRIANGIRRDLFDPVHKGAVNRLLKNGPAAGDPQQPARDLDQVSGFLAGNGPVAIIDLPWVAVFLVVLFALHWSLGLTALAGCLVLGAIAWETGRRSNAGTAHLLAANSARHVANEAELRFAETARAMGMQDRLRWRSAAEDKRYTDVQGFLARSVAQLGGAGRIFRLFLQSAILTVGALLVLDGSASGGIILGSSILAGRALAPVDQILSHWRGMAAAREGWNRIAATLVAHQPASRPPVMLPLPTAHVALRDAWVAPPGSNQIVLQGVSLDLRAGDGLALIGPSAAGKTSLAKVLLGLWQPQRGELRLDGATPDQWEPARFGSALGYLPQTVELLEGTVAQNISRFDPDALSEAIIDAARQASLHETILALPEGYSTRISAGGPEISAGQRQRIGLARALHGNPFLVVLDEPGSNLDADGDAGLAQAVTAVRRRGGIVVMVTHRPATLETVSHVAVMAAGRIVDIGERDAVLARMAAGREAAKGAALPAQTGRT